MSTSYHVHCRTCDTEVTGGWCDQTRVFAVIANRGYFVALGKLLEEPPAGIELDFGRGCLTVGYADEGFDFVAFRVHADHELVVMDEYGHASDECAEYFQCGECKSTHYCLRPKGHEGGHRSVKGADR